MIIIIMIISRVLSSGVGLGGEGGAMIISRGGGGSNDNKQGSI